MISQRPLQEEASHDDVDKDNPDNRNPLRGAFQDVVAVDRLRTFDDPSEDERVDEDARKVVAWRRLDRRDQCMLLVAWKDKGCMDLDRVVVDRRSYRENDDRDDLG